MSDWEITVDLSPSGRYIEGFKQTVDTAMMAMAQRTASQASANTVRVDTGLMKNSWNSIKVGFLDYIAGSFGCDYAIFHELGTRYMGATPMLIPAFEHEWNLFKQTLSAAGMLV